MIRKWDNVKKKQKKKTTKHSILLWTETLYSFIDQRNVDGFRQIKVVPILKSITLN